MSLRATMDAWTPQRKPPQRRQEDASGAGRYNSCAKEVGARRTSRSNYKECHTTRRSKGRRGNTTHRRRHPGLRSSIPTSSCPKIEIQTSGSPKGHRHEARRLTQRERGMQRQRVSDGHEWIGSGKIKRRRPSTSRSMALCNGNGRERVATRRRDHGSDGDGPTAKRRRSTARQAREAIRPTDIGRDECDEGMLRTGTRQRANSEPTRGSTRHAQPRHHIPTGAEGQRRESIHTEGRAQRRAAEHDPGRGVEQRCHAATLCSWDAATRPRSNSDTGREQAMPGALRHTGGRTGRTTKGI